MQPRIDTTRVKPDAYKAMRGLQDPMSTPPDWNSPCGI